MSREIKFRAWDIDNKKYEYDIAIRPINRIIGVEIFNNEMYPVEFRGIIEQYTGLKDKNGKEIYEGDIVEQFVCGVHQFKGKKCGRSTIWQVRWNKKECCFELHYLNGSLFGDSMMSDGDEYEVIGNIHENPELLGGEE